MAKKATKKIEGDLLAIHFEEGDETLSVDINNIPADIQSKLAMHGLSQKLGDSYAGCDVGEAHEKAAAVLKDLLDGNWSTRVAASGPKATQLAEALATVTSQPLEKAAEVLEAMEKEEIATLRKHPDIQSALATIKLAKATEAAAKAAKAAEGAEPLSI